MQKCDFFFFGKECQESISVHVLTNCWLRMHRMNIKLLLNGRDMKLPPLTLSTIDCYAIHSFNL